MLYQQARSTKTGCTCRVGEARVRFTCSLGEAKLALPWTGRRQRRSQRREGEASPPSFERIRNTVQHALLPLDEVRRIYVAFGEHPAAGSMYMFLGCLGCCGTLQGLVVSLWHFVCFFGSIVAPWTSILTHMGYSWEYSIYIYIVNT